MKRICISVVLTALACLAATAAFAAEAAEPTKDWSKILYWQTPGASAPMPAQEPTAEAAPAVPVAQAVPQTPEAGTLTQANDAALAAGITVVQQSYFADSP